MRFSSIFQVLLCGVLASLAHRVPAQELQRVGSPLVQQYTKSDYRAGNQNWSIAPGQNGLIYAGNNEGLLAFDGQHWNVHPLPNRSTVRSVAAAADGKVYTGGQGEFGYWETGDDGQLAYHSLSLLASGEESLASGEIWKILFVEDQVIFQSFSTLYIYENNTIEVVRGEGQPFLFSYYIEGRVFVELIPSGLHELVGTALVPVQGREALAGANVLSMLSYGNGSVLIGTAKAGLFLMDSQGAIKVWENDAQALLRTAQLNNGLRVSADHFAFGTILNGVVIINKAGELVQHINKTNGLQNNTVLSISIDRQENIWVGLDNGIDRIEITAPVYYYTDQSGLIGTVYAAQLFDGKIYLGTNQGLYYSEWPHTNRYQPFQFSLVAHSQGQVWDLTVIDGELLCGHNEGTFRVVGNRLEEISGITGGWTLLPLHEQPGKMLQGTYTGIALFDRSSASKWKLAQRITGFNRPTEFMQRFGRDKLWASGYQGLYLLTFNDEFTHVDQVQQFGPADGLPANAKRTNVFSLSGKTVFATDSGFYEYDEISNRFSRYDQLNEKVGTFATANKIIDAGAGQYWFVQEARVALARFEPDGTLTIDSARFAALTDRMMKYYENINQVNDRLFLISLDNGFAIYQQPESPPNHTTFPAPLIRAVHNITDSLSGDTYSLASAPAIPYKHNNIRIRYAAPWYSVVPLKYQFYLEGHSRTWSEWSEEAQREFTNLRWGEYAFRVRAMAPDGAVSEVSTFRFVIKHPWYLSWKAIAMYVVLLLLILVAVRKWYAHKIKKHRMLVQQSMAKRQQDLLKQKAEENEHRLMLLKNEQLERELANKRRELANAAMNIVYNNELLTNVHDELLQLKDKEGRKLSNEQLLKINKIIDDARSDERDWNLFENSFNEAHENFFKRLKTDYPELVPNDLKLCAYLRMNMSSKEIASLLNITTRGVEIRRYRLRKKLSLPPGKNLTEFLMER